MIHTVRQSFLSYKFTFDVPFACLSGRASRHNQKWRGSDESIWANLKQYNLNHLYLDIMVADASRHELWRQQGIFDAIITDRMILSESCLFSICSWHNWIPFESKLLLGQPRNISKWYVSTSVKWKLESSLCLWKFVRKIANGKISLFQHLMV